MSLIKTMTQKWEKICRGNSLFFRLYALPYRKTVRREIELADIKSEDRILNIGCGALPFTAYYLALLSGAKVIAVDIDEQALTGAQKSLGKAAENNDLELEIKNYSGKQAVENCDFDVVVAALQTENKAEILQHLSHNKPGQSWKFVVREPRPKFADQYDSLTDSISPADKIKQYFPTFDRSVLYTDKANFNFQEAG